MTVEGYTYRTLAGSPTVARTGDFAGTGVSFAYTDDGAYLDYAHSNVATPNLHLHGGSVKITFAWRQTRIGSDPSTEPPLVTNMLVWTDTLAGVATSMNQWRQVSGEWQTDGSLDLQFDNIPAEYGRIATLLDAPSSEDPERPLQGVDDPDFEAGLVIPVYAVFTWETGVDARLTNYLCFYRRRSDPKPPSMAAPLRMRQRDDGLASGVFMAHPTSNQFGLCQRSYR